MKLLRNSPTILKSASIYMVLNMINAVIPIALLPVLTRYLSPADYGLLSNIQLLFLLFVPFAGINLSASATRQFVKKDVDFPVYIGSSVLFSLISTAVLSIIVVAFLPSIVSLTKIPVNYIYVILVYAWINNLIETTLAIARMRDDYKYYGFSKITRTIIELVISLLLVIHFNMNWIGRFGGIFFAALWGFLLAAFYMQYKKDIRLKWKKRYIKYLLSYGLPLIPHLICGAVMFYSDKIIITNMLGLKENGIYSVAYMLGMGVSLIQNSFNQAWIPWLYKKLEMNEKNIKAKLVKITYLYFVAMIIIAVLFWLVAPYAFLVLGKDFKTGATIVGMIGLGFAFNGMYKMVVNYIFYSEKTAYILAITISSAILNIFLNIWLIKKYGLYGAAIAMAITMFVEFILAWIFSNIAFKMPWFTKSSFEWKQEK